MALGVGRASGQPRGMTPDHLQRAATALQALDVDGLVALYADGFRFEDPSAGQVITGREELRAYFTALFGSLDASFSDVQFFGDGDHAAGCWTWSGTNARTGRPFAIRGASIFELGPGGITRETIFYDPAAAT